MDIKSKFRHKNKSTYILFLRFIRPASEAENIITLIFNYTD